MDELETIKQLDKDAAKLEGLYSETYAGEHTAIDGSYKCITDPERLGGCHLVMRAQYHLMRVPGMDYELRTKAARALHDIALKLLGIKR